MTYQTYEKNIKKIFSLFGIIFAVNLLIAVLDQNFFAHALSVISYYFLRILVLYLLFFSIYAQLAKVKEARMLEKPVIFIFFGLLAAVVYVGAPIGFYFMTSTNDIEPYHIYNISQFEKVQKEATYANLLPKHRQYLARQFYLDTGKAILYLDSNNKKVTYIPDNETIKFQNKMKETTESLTVLRHEGKITAYSLIVLLVLSSVSFSVFLYKSKTHMSSSET